MNIPPVTEIVLGGGLLTRMKSPKMVAKRETRRTCEGTEVNRLLQWTQISLQDSAMFGEEEERQTEEEGRKELNCSMESSNHWPAMRLRFSGS